MNSNHDGASMMLIRLSVAVLALSGIVLVTGTHAQQRAADGGMDRVRLEQRLAAVETLLEKSSAARQVESSGDSAAREKRDKARKIYRQARTAFEAGEYARASQLLPEASVQMFEAVRLAAPEAVTTPKARSDYQVRLDSVNSLLAAYQRVAAEKPGAVGVAETSRDIDNLIREAERLAAAGKFDTGRAALDRAYLVAKAAVSSLRSGDTLVRSLHFATREEEYRYELDRNDTHQMLIKVLLEGKARTAGQRSSIDKASQLRAQADAAAAGADHGGAVQLLEESTRELIRVIRSAGVFIPG
ncbi:MAG: hypothetical protein ACT4P8_13630 [Betaproteobacteria bacterium]